ncbi:hypothetical protein Hanom_Chr07g00658661 [Helianthus anomalus]
MRTRRQPRCWRISEILKTFDAVDGLLLLSGTLTGPSVRDGGIHDVVLPDSSRNRTLSSLADDNNMGVTR